MENEKNYIENLYSDKFKKFEIKTSEEEWDSLNSKLIKTNFFKFSFVTFNIFYLMAFLAFAGSTAYFGISNVLLTKKVKFLENVLSHKQNTENNDFIVNDSILSEKTVMNAKAAVLNIKKIQQKSTQKITDIKNISSKEPKISEPANDIDTVKSIIQALNDTTVIVKSESVAKPLSEIQKVTKVKKTVLIKKDTVFVKDTVVIKKPAK